MKSVVLVAVQLLTIGYLLLTGPWLATPTWAGLELVGMAVAAWAVVTMKPHRISPLPDVRRNARLVTQGPYRFIRHPMYTGILLALLALVLDHPTPARVIVWLIMLADLVVKLDYEERLLRKRFPEYASYQCRTKRLLPFVY